MNFFGKSQVLHHFKICFPIPVEKYAFVYKGCRTA